MDKDETYAYFTIDGSGDSSVVTDIIGVIATREYSEGAPRERIGNYQTMKWMLYSRLDKDGALHDTLEQHVEDVLTQVEEFKDNLALLGEEYDKYIQCVAYYHGANLGCGLSKSLVERAAALGLSFEFDLYTLSDEPQDA